MCYNSLKVSDNLKTKTHTTNEKLAIASVNYVRKHTGLNQGLYTLIASIKNDDGSTTPSNFDKSMILAFDPTFLSGSTEEEIMKVAFLEAYKAYLYFLIQRSEMGLVVTEFSEDELSLFSEEFELGEITESTIIYQLANQYSSKLLSEISKSSLTASNLIKNYYGLYNTRERKH
jgi:hypothetical protein